MTTQKFRDSLTEEQVLEMLEHIDRVEHEIEHEITDESSRPRDSEIDTIWGETRKVKAKRLKGPEINGSLITHEDAERIICLMRPDLTSIITSYEDEDFNAAALYEREAILNTAVRFGETFAVRFLTQTQYEAIWEHLEMVRTVLEGEPIQSYNGKYLIEVMRRLHSRDEFIYRHLQMCEKMHDDGPMNDRLCAAIETAAIAHEASSLIDNAEIDPEFFTGLDVQLAELRKEATDESAKSFSKHMARSKKFFSDLAAYIYGA